MLINHYAMVEQAKQRAMTLGNSPTPFDGACNFFDRCTDDLMSLHFREQLPLLDWMGFNVSDTYHKALEFITFVRPQVNDGTPTAGHLADPCADPNGWQFGTAKLTLDDFGRYGRKGPVRDMMKPTKYCETDPRRRLDGRLVTNEREWDIRFTTEVILQDIQRHLITGNASTPGQFGGLEHWVKTGYSSSMLDSIVIDWNANPLTGGASGKTWNGGALANALSFVNVLRSVVRRIKQRLSWSPSLASQRMRLGDMILVMPSHTAEALLDVYTCWSVCIGGQYNEVNLQTYEARSFRDSLNGGLYGAGQITIDGMPIPIMAYDYELIKGPTLNDIYLLTGSVGSVRLWEGEHLSATAAANAYGDQGYFSVDGGRILAKYDTENECSVLKEWLHPRIWTRAPWAQVRFQDVAVNSVGPILSPDPLATSFFPLTSFGGDLAECA